MSFRAFLSCAGLRRFVSRWLLAAMIVAASAGATRARAQAAEAYGKEAVRAVFLINFLRFTEWPPGSLSENSPYVVGVAGSRALEEELLALAEKQLVHDRRIRVVRVKNMRDLSGCHVLYINPDVTQGEEPAPGARELLPHVRNRPVLTVSASPAFLAGGGIVNFYAGEEGTLRFEIAPENAKSVGLVISSRLLALARAVNPPTKARAAR